MTFHYWKHMLLLFVAGPVLIFLSAGSQRMYVTQMGVAATNNLTMGLMVEDALDRLDQHASEEPLDPAWVQDYFERLAKGVSAQDGALSKMAATWTPPRRDGYQTEFGVLYFVLVAFLMTLFSWRDDMRLAKHQRARTEEPVR